jgi:hypothetical protein
MSGKWEARVVIPSGGWTITVTDSGGTATDVVSLAAAETYYHSSTGTEANDLPAEIQAQLNASGTLNGTYAVTVSAGEGGTGKYTLSATETFTVSWPAASLDLRNLLGWTSGLAGQSTYTAPNAAEGLWLPDCPVETPYGLDSAGKPRSAALVTLSEDGTYFATHGDYVRNNSYYYRAVSKARAIQASEATTNESYESFWFDAVTGEEPWANAGRQLRWYKDADTDATYQTYNAVRVAEPMLERTAADYDGLWQVTIEVVEN